MRGNNIARSLIQFFELVCLYLLIGNEGSPCDNTPAMKSVIIALVITISYAGFWLSFDKTISSIRFDIQKLFQTDLKIFGVIKAYHNIEEIFMKTDIIRAYERIQSYIQKTPLIRAHAICHLTGANVFFKLENIQHTGSFKIRGALNKILSLDSSSREKGIITASSGNHGAAVAYAARLLNIPVKIFVPVSTPKNKLENIELFGIIPELVGNDAGESEKKANEYAKQKNLIYISPYNDFDIICGQGTIGYELEKQLDTIDEVYVAVGGGGLISGIGGYLKKIENPPKIIACLPEASPVMYESIKAGRMIKCDIKPTLSDGTAGNNDLDSITFEFCRQFVDDYSLVSETEISGALMLALEKEHLLLEGAAGVPIAALLKHKNDIKDKNIVVIACGGNISLTTLRKIICS